MHLRAQVELGQSPVMAAPAKLRDDIGKSLALPKDVRWEVAPGLTDYPDALARMESEVALIAKGEAPELVWLVEHPPLYTAGTSAKPADLVDPSRFPVYEAGRGGQYTYHGPGQRVAYVMLDLRQRGNDVRAFVTALEDWIIRTLKVFGIAGGRREDRVGVWVNHPELAPDREDKIAAIGIRVRHGVSFHGISINLGTKGTGASGTLQIIALMTVLSLAPSVVIMMTSFTRTIIVLSFVRNALGTQQIPPNQVMVGVALFLTMFVMTPTFGRINDQAVQPLINNRINEQTALRRAEAPLRDFMFNQMSSDSSEIAMFMDMAKEPKATTRADVPTRVLIPAFVLSELKKSFEIGFLVFIPFLIIDIVVASTVMSMGMVMLPPTVISLPFKILLFVLVDGWTLVAESLVRGFNAG